MIRKISFLALIASVFVISACEDFGTISIDTSLVKAIVANVDDEPEQVGTALKTTGVGSYSFSEQDTLDLKGNEDLKDYIDLIKDVEVLSVSCSLEGIPEGETIEELTISVDAAGMGVTLYNLTENNSEISMDVSSAVLTALGSEFLNKKKIMISISGSTSCAPMVLGINLRFNSKVKADIIE